MLGISVIICCHNSEDELPKTIEHLANQEVSEDIPWEVIIIDNASKDNTAKVALDCWPKEKADRLRVIHESQLGIVFARYRGLAEAKYEILSFIDDDNWVCPNWIQTASEVMTEQPEVAACGSHNIPAFEGERPWWFDLSAKSYAVGTQGPDSGGDITCSRGRLIGAGLTIRKTAWQQLLENGFKSLLVGCKGKSLNRGEDTELCFALVLAGWKLWYEPRMTLQHHLTADRLHWKHLRKLRRCGGQATLGFDPYRLALDNFFKEHKISFWWKCAKPVNEKSYHQIWRQQMILAIKDLLQHPKTLLQALIWPMEGNTKALNIETKIGRLLELIKERDTYSLKIQNVQQATWKKAR